MRRMYFIFLCVFGIVGSLVANDGKPSFDCKKAVSVVENLICADSNLANLDSKMAALYKQKRANLDENGKKELLKNQKEWIKKYQACKTRDCLVNILESRIYYLQNLESSNSYAYYGNVGGNGKPSFDCKKAVSVVENLICADSNLANLDSKMAALYKQKRANLDEDSKKELLNSQREYIKKSQNCKTKECLIKLLESRIYYLENFQDSQVYAPKSYNQNIESKPKFTPKSGKLEYDDTKDVTYKQDSKKNYNWSESQAIGSMAGFYLLRQDNPNKYRGEITISNCKNNVCSIEFSGQDSEQKCVLERNAMSLNTQDSIIEFKNSQFSGCKISATFSKNSLVLNKQEWALDCNRICPSLASGFRFKEAYDRQRTR